MADQRLHQFNPSEQIIPSFLQHFTPLGSPNVTSFYTLCTGYPLTLTTFYSHWQPNSYNILPPLNQLPPNSYTILTPLAAQRLHQFNPSEQTIPSFLQHFTPLGSPNVTSFYPLWTNYLLTLTLFFPAWQPHSYIFLPPLNQLPPNSYTTLPILAA